MWRSLADTGIKAEFTIRENIYNARTSSDLPHDAFQLITLSIQLVNIFKIWHQILNRPKSGGG
jgi:hypothetical protein